MHLCAALSPEPQLGGAGAPRSGTIWVLGEIDRPDRQDRLRSQSGELIQISQAVFHSSSLLVPWKSAMPMCCCYCTATVTFVSQVMSPWSPTPTLILSSTVGSTTRRSYFHPFGPVKVIDCALLSMALIVTVIVLSSDAVPPGRSPCPAVEVPVDRKSTRLNSSHSR